MAAGETLGQTIGEERPCVKCGYNLVGLPVGGSCPECGTAIIGRKKKRGRFDDSLEEAPSGYLWLLAGSLVSQALAVVVAVFWAILVFVRDRAWNPVPPVATGVVYAAASLLWSTGGVLTTWPRPRQPGAKPDGVLDNGGWQWATRVFVAMPGLSGLAGVARGLTGEPAFTVVALVLLVPAAIGLAPVCVYLAGLSMWAQESGAASRLRGSAWCACVCGPLVLGAAGLLTLDLRFKLLITVAMVAGLLGLALGAFLLLWGMLGLANASVWAVHNAKEAREREIRAAERERRQREAEDAQYASMDAAAEAPSEKDVDDALDRLSAEEEPPVPVDEPAPREIRGQDPSGRPRAARSRMAGEHVIERGDDENPYELAPED